jgi:hypothetical protein
MDGRTNRRTNRRMNRRTDGGTISIEHIYLKRALIIFRFRGQTQSQYLNFGDKSEDGKAEAEATQHSSRATVGMFANK